jgi:hypothetical protein
MTYPDSKAYIVNEEDGLVPRLVIRINGTVYPFPPEDGPENWASWFVTLYEAGYRARRNGDLPAGVAVDAINSFTLSVHPA